MTTDLTKISGIGSNSAKALVEAGFDSIETIAKTTPEALGKVSGFGPKRAARVIAMAKDLVQDAKPAPVVAPTVATKAAKVKTSPKAAPIKTPAAVTVKTPAARRGRARTVFASAAVLLLLVAAVLYFGYGKGISDFTPFQTAQQDTAKTPAKKAGQQANRGPGNAGNVAMVAPGQTAPGQQPMNRAFNPGAPNMSAMQRHPNEPQWVSRQRAEAQAQAQMHRARAEKQNEASWNRFIASLPPAQAQQAIWQRDMAMKQMEESQKRQAAMIQQHNAYMNQRFGG